MYQKKTESHYYSLFPILPLYIKFVTLFKFYDLLHIFKNHLIHIRKIIFKNA